MIEKLQAHFDITGVFLCDFNFNKNKKMYEQAAEWIQFLKEYYDIEHQDNFKLDKLDKKIVEQVRKTIKDSCRKKGIDFNSLDKNPRENLIRNAADLILEYEQSPLKARQLFSTLLDQGVRALTPSVNTSLRKKSIEIMLTGTDFITMVANVNEEEISSLNEVKRDFRKEITGSNRSSGLVHTSSNLKSGFRMLDLITGACAVQEIKNDLKNSCKNIK